MLIKRTGCQEFKITLPWYPKKKNRNEKEKLSKRTEKRATQKDFYTS